MTNWRGRGKAPLRAAEYSRLCETIAGGKSKVSQTIGNNTVARLHDNGTADDGNPLPPDVIIRLHATDIVRLKPDGSATFTAGGWRTVTTKERMNKVLGSYGVRIDQCNGAWSIRGTYHAPGVRCAVCYREAETAAKLDHGRDCTAKELAPIQCDMLTFHRTFGGFRDGVTVRRLRNGKVRVTGAEPNGEEKTKRRRAKIRKFATEYVRRLRARELPAPGGGDCFMCACGTTRDCIESHIGEGYYVPRLMTNALADGGFAPVMQWCVASAFGALKNGKGETVEYAGQDWEWTMVRKRFTRWLMRKLGEVS